MSEAPKVLKSPGLIKKWRAHPVHKALAWAFVLHGYIALATDFWGFRAPFLVSDVLAWWNFGLEVAAQLRGVKVKVGS